MNRHRFASQCDIRPVPRLAPRLRRDLARAEPRFTSDPRRRRGSLWNSGVGINADENWRHLLRPGDAYDRSTTPWNGTDNGPTASSASRHRLGVGSRHDVHPVRPPTREFPADLSLGNGGGILLRHETPLPRRRQAGSGLRRRPRQHGQRVSRATQIAVQKWTASKQYGTPGGGAFYE